MSDLDAQLAAFTHTWPPTDSAFAAAHGCCDTDDDDEPTPAEREANVAASRVRQAAFAAEVERSAGGNCCET